MKGKKKTGSINILYGFTNFNATQKIEGEGGEGGEHTLLLLMFSFSFYIIHDSCK